MARSTDLARLLSTARSGTPPPDAAQQVQFRQGTVTAWDPVTGNNTVLVGTTSLTNLPLLNAADSWSLAVGDSVAVLEIGGSSRTAAIFGRVTTPGDAATPGALGRGHPTSASIATSESTSSGSYTDLATSGPAVTVVVGASGKLTVQVGASVSLSGSTSSQGGLMGFALSGANTAAAADSQAFQAGLTVAGAWNAAFAGGSPLITLTGLAPGSTTVTAKYRASGTGSPSFANRYVTAIAQ